MSNTGNRLSAVCPKIFTILLRETSTILYRPSKTCPRGKKQRTVCAVPACLNPQTLQHVVSTCNVHLEQGRFTWRHNSILKTLAEYLSSIKKNFLIYADIEGFDNPSVIITFCIIVLLGYNFKTNFLISSCTTITQPRCLCKNSECWLSSHTDRLIF